MEKIKIVIDSGSDFVLPAPEGIEVLPIAIRFGDEEFLDGVTISHKEFYERLIESDALPKTSLISPGQFSETFEAAINEGYKVLTITISGKLSGTYQSAMVAASAFPGQVAVVDSATVAVGEQALALYALERVQEGLSFEEVVAKTEAAVERLHVIAILDTLEYLKLGGRISASVAFVGGVLSIKPVVTTKDGVVAVLGKARGSKNGNNLLIQEIHKTGGVDFDCPVVLGYTGLSDVLLQKYMKDSAALWEGHEDSLRFSSIGAAIGTHVGPDAVAVAFFAK